MPTRVRVERGQREVLVVTTIGGAEVGVQPLVAAVLAAGTLVAADSAVVAEILVVVVPQEIGREMDAESFFTSEEKERIRQAVEAAEQRTAGEIVPMVVSSSGRYGEVETAGLALGLLFGTLAAFMWHDPWAAVHSNLLWPLSGAALGYFVCSVSSVKRRLISKQRIAEAVHLRSLAAFTAHGLHYTRAHTGVLILVSLLERRVVILADKGINEKVSAGTWDEVVQIITTGLQNRNACDGFCKAIERCGEILAQHFPRPPDDKDELANKLVTER